MDLQNNIMDCFDPSRPPCGKGENCDKVVHKNAEIDVPVMVKPDVKIGKIKAECVGEPVIRPEHGSCADACEFVITQKVRVKIPICYDIDVVTGKAEINCKDDCSK